MGRALVLGGGGITSTAWELGILTGLRDMGIDLTTTADLVVGTSSGAVTAAQASSGIDLGELYERQLAAPDGETAVRLNGTVLAAVGWTMLRARNPEAGRAHVGLIASRTARVFESEHLRVTADRLPKHSWPERDLLITAVDARSGALRAFSRNSGAGLVEAVAASGAMPGTWAPVRVCGRPYIDGGLHSSTNVHLAAEHERVVVLAAITAGGGPFPSPAAQAADLPEGVRVALVTPSIEARAVFSRNRLDPARRASAARAGRSQAVEVAIRVARVWGV